jgi:hypothetical protein
LTVLLWTGKKKLEVWTAFGSPKQSGRVTAELKNKTSVPTLISVTKYSDVRSDQPVSKSHYLIVMG